MIVLIPSDACKICRQSGGSYGARQSRMLVSDRQEAPAGAENNFPKIELMKVNQSGNNFLFAET